MDTLLLSLTLTLGCIVAVSRNSSGIREKATFAGGCFWCMEPPFEKLKGVFLVTAGYTGGQEKSPTYEMVSSGQTGHVEAVQVLFDPEIIAYKELLAVFWKQIDPTDPDGQFADRGSQYRTAIFFHNDKQRETALESKSKMQTTGKFDAPIVTSISKVSQFYQAEKYHQSFYKKNPVRYKAYKLASGRQSFLDHVWGKPTGS